MKSCFLAGCRNEEATKPSDTPSAQPENPPAALSGDALAEWLVGRGRYAEALPLVEQAVAQRAGDPLPRAEALMTLGMILDAMGDHDIAIPKLLDAWYHMDEYEAPLDARGACLDALGLAFHSNGEYEKAEEALNGAIEYRRAASPENDEPWVNASRVHLGRLYLTMARFDEAERLLRGALKSAVAGTVDTATMATRYRNMGTYHHTVGSYGAAIAAFEKARGFTTDAFGESSAQVAAILGDLGLAQLRSGDREAAEHSLLASHNILQSETSRENLATCYLFAGDAKRALSILENVHWKSAVAMNNLGSAYLLDGRHELARSAFDQARSLAREQLETHHPLHVQIGQNEACLHFDAGHPDKALASARRASESAVSLLGHLLEFGSETQKLEFRRTSDPLSQLCSFGGTPEEIADAILRTKGVVLGSLMGEKHRNGEVEWKMVAAALGDTEALVDYAVYKRYEGVGKWTRHYGAVVLVKNAGPVWIPLGPERRLRPLLADLRAHMDAEGNEMEESGAFLSLEAVLKGLHAFAWKKLAEALPETVRMVYLSPDGLVGFMPFAALLAEGRFLCEEIDSAATVASGRALLDAPEAPAEGPAVIVAVDRYAGRSKPWPGPVSGLSPKVWGTLAELGNLPGVVPEGETVSRLAGGALLRNATEASLRENLASPSVFHFSGHAFFEEGEDRPMTRSGLVLGGMRESLDAMASGKDVSEKDDNVLFAGEIATLPLEGTQLVVLSACETGLGVSQSGEGVLGLRRGFQLAGARNLLMTLWPIVDESASEFVSAFYREFLDGSSPAEAVWRNQRRLLRERAGDLRGAVFSAAGYQLTTRGVSPPPLAYVYYYVAPDFLEDGETEVDDPFTPSDGTLKKKRTAREILGDAGVTFPDGAVIHNSFQWSGFGMRNTLENHARVRAYLDRVKPGNWHVREGRE